MGKQSMAISKEDSQKMRELAAEGKQIERIVKGSFSTLVVLGCLH